MVTVDKVSTAESDTFNSIQFAGPKAPSEKKIWFAVFFPFYNRSQFKAVKTLHKRIQVARMETSAGTKRVWCDTNFLIFVDALFVFYMNQ